jgi:hypothetical protein
MFFLEIYHRAIVETSAPLTEMLTDVTEMLTDDQWRRLAKTAEERGDSERYFELKEKADEGALSDWDLLEYRGYVCGHEFMASLRLQARSKVRELDYPLGDY